MEYEYATTIGSSPTWSREYGWSGASDPEPPDHGDNWRLVATCVYGDSLKEADHDA